MPIPVGCNLDLNDNTRVRSALDPILPQDYATKAYVDNLGVELRSFSFSAARNANINTEQALRRQNGVFLSTSPYIVPYDGIIYAATAENDTTDTGNSWDLEIEINGSSVLTVSVPIGQYKSISNGLNISVSEGDEIVFFFRNNSAAINRPAGSIFLRETGLAGKQSYSFAAARNANISTDQALRRQNGVFLSTSPYIVPFNSILYAATAENSALDTSETWQLDIEVNGVIVVSLNITSSIYKITNNSLNIAVNEGDEIVFFFRNASGAVTRPGGTIYLLEA